MEVLHNPKVTNAQYKIENAYINLIEYPETALF